MMNSREKITVEYFTDKETVLRLMRQAKDRQQSKLYEYSVDEPDCIRGTSIEAIRSRVAKGDRGEDLLNSGLEKLLLAGLKYQRNGRTVHDPDFQVSAPLKADIDAKDWANYYKKTTNHIKKNIINKSWRRGAIRIAAFKRDPLFTGKNVQLLDRAKIHVLTFTEVLSLLRSLLIPDYYRVI
jgi:hypothetical protein